MERVTTTKVRDLRTFMPSPGTGLPQRKRMGTNGGSCKRHRNWLPSSWRRLGRGKKKRREQGKMLRGAQFSEHRGSYSPFKPYTV